MYVYRNNFAFLHIVKCGGNSIRKTIPSTPSKEILKYKHLPLSSLKKHLGNKFDDLTIYANIRNPFSRIVSMCFYRNKSRFKLSGKTDVEFFEQWFWEKFVEAEWQFDDPFDCMLLVDGEIPKNLMVVKLEEADEIYPIVIKKHFGKDVVLRRDNQSVHRDHRVYYDSLSEKFVREREQWVLNNFYKET